MKRCCWYQTNVRTLARYALNLLLQCFHNPEEDLAELCTQPIALPAPEVILPAAPLQEQVLEERAS